MEIKVASTFTQHKKKQMKTPAASPLCPTTTTGRHETQCSLWGCLWLFFVIQVTNSQEFDFFQS